MGDLPLDTIEFDRNLDFPMALFYTVPRRRISVLLG
jgi:hypothetical protein